tara:strand:+ start:3430 stop:3681 length:252 start_codon:yes stop_codon:yes gene_type:complete
MNGRQAKKLRRKSFSLLTEWLRSMTPEGEAVPEITKENIHEYMPEQVHVYGMGKMLLSAYSLRWFNKKVKKNPNITLEEILNG